MIFLYVSAQVTCIYLCSVILHLWDDTGGSRSHDYRVPTKLRNAKKRLACALAVTHWQMWALYEQQYYGCVCIIKQHFSACRESVAV